MNCRMRWPGHRPPRRQGPPGRSPPPGREKTPFEIAPLRFHLVLWACADMPFVVGYYSTKFGVLRSALHLGDRSKMLRTNLTGSCDIPVGYLAILRVRAGMRTVRSWTISFRRGASFRLSHDSRRLQASAPAAPAAVRPSRNGSPWARRDSSIARNV